MTDFTGMTITAALATITPTSSHIAYAQSLGSSPAGFLDVIAQKISDAVESLVQFQNTMPAEDENIANVTALIALIT